MLSGAEPTADADAAASAAANDAASILSIPRALLSTSTASSYRSPILAGAAATTAAAAAAAGDSASTSGPWTPPDPPATVLRSPSGPGLALPPPPPPPSAALAVPSLALVAFVLVLGCLSRASSDVPKKAKVAVRVRVKPFLAVLLGGGNVGDISAAVERLLSMLLLPSLLLLRCPR